MTENKYNADSIKVLKGLEPVKARPGMYTRTDHPGHIIQEVLDNAIDEAMAKFCTAITVKIWADKSISIADNGRGIPVEKHPVEKVSTVEVVFTRLHAGGKFNKDGDASAYRFSGGLHGVGVSVTNALSTRLEVKVARDGGLWEIAFSGGDVISPLQRKGDMAANKSGTMVRVWPDPKYFDQPQVPIGDLEKLLRSKAVLLPGLKVTLEVEGGEKKSWKFNEGMREYLSSQIELSGVNEIAAFYTDEKYASKGDEQFSVGEGASWAVVWSPEGGLHRESFVNLIPTPSGGTHEAGLRDGLYQAVRSFVEHHSMLPKGIKLSAEDVFSRASFVLSSRLLDPSFQGQTKERLNTREAMALVSRMVKDPFELWLNEHLEEARKIAELAIKSAQARSRAAQKVEKRKQSGVAVLPGKLSDCESEDITQNELFLVEGDSAGGSAKGGRNKETQAILPLRGKVLNTFEVEAGRLFANNEVHDISVALGIDPHGWDAPNEVLSGLRYGKLIIMADADVDGAHIQALLLTLFFTHFPRLVTNGHVYAAQPPLYRIDTPGQGKSKPPRKFYALDEAERAGIIDRLLKEGVKEEVITVSRFKGLGEMSSEQLWETTMSPDTRRLVQIDVSQDAHKEAFDTMRLLMAKGESGSRRQWMEENGDMIDPE